jgi:hypothetical protein
MAQLTLQGKLISTTVTGYDFTDKTSGERIVGEKMVIWIDQGPQNAPAELSTRDDKLFRAVGASGPGVAWSIVCELGAKVVGGSSAKVVLQAISARPAMAVVGNGAPVPAKV